MLIILDYKSWFELLLNRWKAECWQPFSIILEINRKGRGTAWLANPGASWGEQSPWDNNNFDLTLFDVTWNETRNRNWKPRGGKEISRDYWIRMGTEYPNTPEAVWGEKKRRVQYSPTPATTHVLGCAPFPLNPSFSWGLNLGQRGSDRTQGQWIANIDENI